MSIENFQPGQQGASSEESTARQPEEQLVVAEPSSVEPGTLEPVVLTRPTEPTAPESSLSGPPASWAEPAPGHAVSEQATAAYGTTQHPGPAITGNEPVAEAATQYVVSAPYAAPTPSVPPQAVGIPGGEIYPQQHFYASSPVPPKKRGNRLGGTLIALLGAVAFAVVYAGVAAALFFFNPELRDPTATLVRFVSSPAFIVPIVFFAIALVLAVLIVNRARWWAYVLGGFLVAVVVYFGALVGDLVAVRAWELDQAAQLTFLKSVVLDPLTLAAAIVAREVTVWAGAWISSRGRKITARNVTAREEYDRKLTEAPVPAASPVGSPAW